MASPIARCPRELVVLACDERRQRIGNEHFISALPVDKSRRENANCTAAMFRVRRADETIHRDAELHAVTNHFRNLAWQRHRERAADARAALRVDDRRPRTRAHGSVCLLDDAAFDPHSQVGIQRDARRRRASYRATYRLVVAKRLVGDRRRNCDTLDRRRRRERAEHRAHRTKLYWIRRADGDGPRGRER